VTDQPWNDATESGPPPQQPGYQPGYPPQYPQYPQYPAGGPGAPYYDPSAPYGRHPVTGQPFSDKSKTVAGLLQLLSLIGVGGIGRFYIGDIGIGVAQLLVGWLTCGIGLIWPIIDAILMLTGSVPDSQGRPLRDGT
jgi:TM2 domain-containing membrane protein YozV